MIYTVTFNPAIDYVVHADDVRLGMVNRSNAEEMYIGGKGINVSLVLHELGIPSKALGFIAGFTGQAIENGVRQNGIEADFVHLEKGCSRINVKIKSIRETELNGQGPDISAEALEALFEKLDALTDGDTLVLAGSIPGTLPADIYEQILCRLSDRKIRTVVDASGELLLRVLRYHPFLIKPNNYELGELFGTEPQNIEEIEMYARRLRAMGAQNVLVSMAGDGALLIDENDERHLCRACKGIVRNSVGAGDSMVAGFLAGIRSGSYEDALRLGTASGGATAFSSGLGEKHLIDALLKELSE